jgi:hypothetical protein
MNIRFTKNGWIDYMHWAETYRKMLLRINRLINEIVREPFVGIGNVAISLDTGRDALTMSIVWCTRFRSRLSP